MNLLFGMITMISTWHSRAVSVSSRITLELCVCIVQPSAFRITILTYSPWVMCRWRDSGPQKWSYSDTYPSFVSDVQTSSISNHFISRMKKQKTQSFNLFVWNCIFVIFITWKMKLCAILLDHRFAPTNNSRFNLNIFNEINDRNSSASITQWKVHWHRLREHIRAHVISIDECQQRRYFHASDQMVRHW